MRSRLFRFVVALAMAAFFYLTVSALVLETTRFYFDLDNRPWWPWGINLLALATSLMLAYGLMQRWVFPSRPPFARSALRYLSACLALMLCHEGLFFVGLASFNLAYPWLLALSLSITLAASFFIFQRYVFP